MGNDEPWHDPDQRDHEAEPREECGVFGVWAPGEDVAKLAYFGLYALQHRGQEAAGIAVSDGTQVLVYKDLGLVSQVFDEQVLSSLAGHIAVGHCRYSTTGSCTWENAQPTFCTTVTGSGLALGHNGNLVNTAELLQQARSRGAPTRRGATTDSDLITGLIAAGAADIGIETAALGLLPQLRGAFSLVFCDERTLYAARDPHGVRPLVLGRLERGWVIASETAALDIVGASFVREVEPGELLAIDAGGLRSSRFASPEPKGCVFEYVYLARPDTTIAGRGVHATRVEIGRRLAIEHPAQADLVIPVPESGTPAAIGYAQHSGIPYGKGLVKNSYVGRTFIQPSQTIRQLGIRLKLNPLRDVIRGKRLVVVDDSIVRGNTQRALVRMLREAGAIEVHVRIASPPVRWPCFYGIDFASRAELIANGVDVDGVRRSIGADSLGYVSLEGLIAASEQPASRLCMACYNGHYPIPLPADGSIGKHLLEDPSTRIPAVGSTKIDLDVEQVIEFPVSIYLAFGDEDTVRRVKVALESTVEEIGFGLIVESDALFGSFWQRFRAKAVEPQTREALHDRLVKLERSVEVQFLSLPESQANMQNAQGLAAIIDSLNGEPAAVIQLGPLLIIKAPDPDVGSIVLCKMLTPKELRLVETCPDMLRDPVALMARLAAPDRDAELD